jgi:ribosomal protein L16 Arg81 hydroxylase
MLSEDTISDRHDLSAERIFSPLTLRQFLDSYWGRRHLVLRRQNPSHYGPLLRFTDVDRYLALAARSPDAWVSMGQGKVAHRSRVQDVKVRNLYTAVHNGDTVLLESIDRFWPDAAKLAEVLGGALSARVKVNAYMTPPGLQGAPIHPDVQDVFVLQMEGAKEWFVYEGRVYEAVETLERIEDLDYSRPSLEGEPPIAERFILEQGDLLYLPRGVMHRAVTPLTTSSLHLTVCVTPTYWVDFIKTVVEAVSISNPELGDALPPGFEDQFFDGDDLHYKLQRLLGLVLEKASFDQAAASYARSSMRYRPYPADGHFEQILSLAKIGSETVVERRRGVEPRVAVEEESAILRFGDSEIKTPVALLPALEIVQNREIFRVRDLPDGLSENSKLVLVRRLIREGLLRARLASDGG